MENQIKYGLMYKGELLGWNSSSNGDAEFCLPTQVYLEDNNDNVWLVNDVKIAEKAANTSVKWYNADYQTPTNDYAGKCKVVKVVMAITEL